MDGYIGENLKYARKAANFSVEYIAQKSGYSTDLIYSVEKKKSKPSVILVATYNKLTNVSLETLFYGTVSDVLKEHQRNEVMLWD